MFALFEILIKVAVKFSVLWDVPTRRRVTENVILC
jgi:hypothetical protein